MKNIKSIKQLLDEKILFLDGAMGTILQKKGLKAGGCPEEWNITNPDEVRVTKYIRGAKTFQTFQQAIDELLASAEQGGGEEKDS